VNRFATIFCFLFLALPAAAVENGQVLYVGGTATTLREGTIGRLDTTAQPMLAFVAGADRLAIPYASIQSYEYSQDVARHLGVLPALGAGLIRKRRHKHFLRITYRDASDVVEVVVFEVPKQMPRSLLAILQTRAPQGCAASTTRCAPAD